MLLCPLTVLLVRQPALQASLCLFIQSTTAGPLRGLSEHVGRALKPLLYLAAHNFLEIAPRATTSSVTILSTGPRKISLLHKKVWWVPLQTHWACPQLDCWRLQRLIQHSLVRSLMKWHTKY